MHSLTPLTYSRTHDFNHSSLTHLGTHSLTPHHSQFALSLTHAPAHSFNRAFHLLIRAFAYFRSHLRTHLLTRSLTHPLTCCHVFATQIRIPRSLEPRCHLRSCNNLPRSTRSLHFRRGRNVHTTVLRVRWRVNTRVRNDPRVRGVCDHQAKHAVLRFWKSFLLHHHYDESAGRDPLPTRNRPRRHKLQLERFQLRCVVLPLCLLMLHVCCACTLTWNAFSTGVLHFR
jgi:hypothetical protein